MTNGKITKASLIKIFDDLGFFREFDFETLYSYEYEKEKTERLVDDILEWESENSYDFEKAKTEKLYDDILDLLPSDPFDMNLSPPIMEITDWNEDFGLKILGFGTDELEVKKEDDELFAESNFDSNSAMSSYQEFDDKKTDEKSIGSLLIEEFLEDKCWESWVAIQQLQDGKAIHVNGDEQFLLNSMHSSDFEEETEELSVNILDLLPSDPFGMNVSVPVISGWNEDLEEDFGLKILGFGTDESEVEEEEEDDQVFTGLNWDSNQAMSSYQELGDMNTNGKSIGSAMDLELLEDKYWESWVAMKQLHLDNNDQISYDLEKEKTEKLCDDILDLLPSDPFGMNISVPKITGRNEDLEDDFGLKLLGFGTDESDVNEEDNDLNSDSNQTMSSYPELGDMRKDGMLTKYAHIEEFYQDKYGISFFAGCK
ncbi:unnamed protein product [Ilex paraguariensis]|uniref:Uncharacterized protein n=1 Tax=Ilex paraguariensis TaxID=185542 RepID=A0ABC8S7R6_9AQUA